MSAKDPSYTISRSNPTPIYRQIADQLRHRILSDEFTKSQKLPSNRELAERYKVNHLTVRQALKLLEQDGIIDIAHGRGAFILGQSPKQLETALVLPSLGQEQSGVISQAVRNELGKDAKLHMMDYHNRPSEEVACLDRILKENYNSAIIYPTMEGEAVRTILRMMADGFPLVLIDRSFSNVPGSYVLSDNQKGGYLATRHLLERGCKHIACVTTDFPNVHERLAGYQQALAEFGVRLERDLIVELPHGGDVGENATLQLLAEDKNVDGIFYYNDYQALIGMKQIKQAGRKIPSDIRVVGFDDLTLARYSEPTLTSIRQNHEIIGREAVKALIEQFKLPPAARFSLHKTVVPVELIERDSTA